MNSTPSGKVELDGLCFFNVLFDHIAFQLFKFLNIIGLKYSALSIPDEKKSRKGLQTHIVDFLFCHIWFCQ